MSHQLQKRRRVGPLALLPHSGFGTPQRVTLGGRVVLPRKVRVLGEDASRFANAANILRRLLSREVGGEEVEASLGGARARALSDQDGYFTLTLTPDAPLSPGWHEVGLSLRGGPDAPVPVLVVARPDLGIISDLDDTVLVSRADSLTALVATTFLNNVRTRQPFPGVAALYRGLQAGAGAGAEPRPLFYVSSSPWNFFDLLWRFLRRQGVPAGPLLLRDWAAGLLGGHGDHKLSRIETLLSTYPDLNFLLIGDSGEEDPELYARVVRDHPGRVRAVYIRDVVHTPGVDARVRDLRRELERAGVPLVLSPDSAGLAQHALAAGWLSPADLRAVVEAAQQEG